MSKLNPCPTASANQNDCGSRWASTNPSHIQARSGTKPSAGTFRRVQVQRRLSSLLCFLQFHHPNVDFVSRCFKFGGSFDADGVIIYYRPAEVPSSATSGNSKLCFDIVHHHRMQTPENLIAWLSSTDIRSRIPFNSSLHMLNADMRFYSVESLCVPHGTRSIPPRCFCVAVTRHLLFQTKEERSKGKPRA